MDTNGLLASDLSGFTLFDFELVPQAWYVQQKKPITLRRDEHDWVGSYWWDHHSAKVRYADYFDGFLSRSEPFLQLDDPAETVWTDKNNHTVGLWETDIGDVAGVVICLDVRYPYSDFLARLVEIAIRSDCIFFMRDEGSFLEPSTIAVVEAVNRSPAGQAVANPATVLRVH